VRSARRDGRAPRSRPSTGRKYDGGNGEIPTPPRRSGGSGRNVTAETTSTRRPQTLDRVVIRFAGDSGDGMQLAGDRFTDVSAAFGNDLATLPNFPAEIRAPAGTLAGWSSFQVHISDHGILTPGDSRNG